MIDETPQLDEVIVFEDENGKEYEARLLAAFEFEHKRYALLKEESTPSNMEPDQELVLMRVLIEDAEGGTIYRSIDDEAEFKRVSDYIYNALLEVESEMYPDQGNSKRKH